MPDISSSNYDLDDCLSKLYNKSLLPEITVRSLCNSLKDYLIQQSNVVQIQTPVTVVGDIHGQFYDLIEIFRIGGFPPNTNYLFLGDYVDRGYYSVETMTLLICLKLRYPERVNLIRGNHESRQITQNYGFYSECIKKYGSARVWTCFTDVFDYLILSAVIDDKIFCVHGGLSPNVQSIDQIKIVDRFKEIPHEGIMADLVWSDPDDEKGDFSLSPRGAGYTFGIDVVKKFLTLNKMEKILRAHQLCNEGYQIYFNGLVTTVWSAPNYCYRCGNKASVLEIFDSNGNENFNVFDAAPENESDLNNDVNEFGEYVRQQPIEYFL